MQKRNRILFNIGLWALILSLEVLFFKRMYVPDFITAIKFVFNRVPAELIVYFSAIYFLIPQFLKDKNFLKSTLLLMFILVVSSIVFRITNYYMNPEQIKEKSLIENFIKWPHFYLEFFYFLRNPIIALALYYLPKFKEIEAEKNEAQRLKVEAEMNLLKSQVQPHFLFNSLNNLYSLALEKSDTTAKYVLKLSEIMEYLLYKATKERIELGTEIHHLKNYVALEKLKLGDRLQVSWNIDTNTQHLQLPPLLLFPFVENAFKHGANINTELTFLTISLQISNNKLVYQVVNSMPEEPQNSAKKAEGSGLNNLKKRMEMYFSDNFDLKNQSNNGSYMATLEINLTAL